MNYATRFIHFYHNVFTQTELYAAMRNTVEDSPWHRELNVAIHTDMVVSGYLGAKTIDAGTAKDWLCGAFAVAFHDVGKPPAEETKYSKERGEYRRYTGHEILSARLWEDYAVKNFYELKEQFPEFDETMILNTAWIIEHHLPFAIKKPAKLNVLSTMTSMMFSERRSDDIFFRCLMADCKGRLSDDHETKIENTTNWINDFRLDHSEHPIVVNEDQEAPVLMLLIGTSGCGKSTYKNNILRKNPEFASFSLDDLREERYLEAHERGTVEGYEKAFNAACNDKKFNGAADVVYNELVKTGVNIIVDNINGSAKRRNKYITMAKTHGYRVVAVTFPNTLEELLARQNSRQDKTVPENSVRRQYFQIQMPSYGEVDEIRIIKTF